MESTYLEYLRHGLFSNDFRCGELGGFGSSFDGGFDFGRRDLDLRFGPVLMRGLSHVYSFLLPFKKSIHSDKNHCNERVRDKD